MTKTRQPTSPPYVLLGNGSVAFRFLKAMQARKYLPELVVLNTRAKQRSGDLLRAYCRHAGIPISAWSPRVRQRLLSLLRRREGTWLLSVYFGHIIDREVLHTAKGRAVNLHPSLLPWCRGVHTNVWPIVDQTPAGVTLHVMEGQVDAGAVLAQAEVAVESWDTGASLYARLEDGAARLLSRCWPRIVAARWPGVPQSSGGTTHRVRDFQTLDRYDLNAHPEARRFFDLLRARSFPPHQGLLVRLRGDVVEATLSLRKVNHA